jgi:hypothetical protein
VQRIEAMRCSWETILPREIDTRSRQKTLDGAGHRKTRFPRQQPRPEPQSAAMQNPCPMLWQVHETVPRWRGMHVPASLSCMGVHVPGKMPGADWRLLFHSAAIGAKRQAWKQGLREQGNGGIRRGGERGHWPDSQLSALFPYRRQSHGHGVERERT